MDSIGLICAVLASLAVGVWMAYCVCLGFFRAIGGKRARIAVPVAPAVSALAIEG